MSGSQDIPGAEDRVFESGGADQAFAFDADFNIVAHDWRGMGDADEDEAGRVAFRGDLQGCLERLEVDGVELDFFPGGGMGGAYQVDEYRPLGYGVEVGRWVEGVAYGGFDARGSFSMDSWRQSPVTVRPEACSCWASRVPR
jgi:hypothetical protein